MPTPPPTAVACHGQTPALPSLERPYPRLFPMGGRGTRPRLSSRKGGGSTPRCPRENDSFRHVPPSCYGLVPTTLHHQLPPSRGHGLSPLHGKGHAYASHKHSHAQNIHARPYTNTYSRSRRGPLPRLFPSSRRAETYASQHTPSSHLQNGPSLHLGSCSRRGASPCLSPSSIRGPCKRLASGSMVGATPRIIYRPRWT